MVFAEFDSLEGRIQLLSLEGEPERDFVVEVACPHFPHTNNTQPAAAVAVGK
jgi:hypothetical protein